jgi:hypothetical protein
MAGEDLYRIAYGFLEGLDGGSFVYVGDRGLEGREDGIGPEGGEGTNVYGEGAKKRFPAFAGGLDGVMRASGQVPNSGILVI